MNVLNKCFIITAIIILYPLWAAAQLRGLDGSVLDKIETGSVIALWLRGTPGVNPDIPEKVKPCGKRFFNIHNPNITVYKPGNSNGVAVVLCAGGGYAYIATGVEGVPTAEKLNQAGITVFVLKYRLPPTPGVNFQHPVPLSDALRALQLVRYYAPEFNINSDKIGIMGFSAGGHLASLAGTMFSEYTFGNDLISKVNSRPDFICLVYSAIATKEGKALSNTQLL
ncbi:MAG: alpha/beta hydrolase, partial [bacterium]